MSKWVLAVKKVVFVFALVFMEFLVPWFCKQSHWEQFWKIEHAKFHKLNDAPSKQLKLRISSNTDSYDPEAQERKAIEKYGPPPTIEQVKKLESAAAEIKEQEAIKKYGPPPSLNVVLAQQVSVQGEQSESKSTDANINPPLVAVTVTLDNNPEQPPTLNFETNA